MMMSLLVKLAMMALTMAVIVWIGWAVPDREPFGRESADTQSHPLALAQGAGAAGPEVAPGPLPRVPQQTRPAAIPAPQGRLDLNRATEQDFESLPGIGPVLAGRIVEYRQDIGAFHGVEQLRNVKGIGKKKFERIRDLVTVTGSTVSTKEDKGTT